MLNSKVGPLSNIHTWLEIDRCFYSHFYFRLWKLYLYGKINLNIETLCINCEYFYIHNLFPLCKLFILKHSSFCYTYFILGRSVYRVSVFIPSNIFRYCSAYFFFAFSIFLNKAISFKGYTSRFVGEVKPCSFD